MEIVLIWRSNIKNQKKKKPLPLHEIMHILNGC